MSTIKISELATSNIALTDFFAKADATGVANKNTVQELSNLLKTVDDTAFKGSIAIADVPSENGWYFASESGTYTNCGGLVINTTDNIAIIIVSGTFDTFNKIDIPVNITIDAIPTEGSANAVQSDGVFDALALKRDYNVNLKLNQIEYYLWEIGGIDSGTGNDAATTSAIRTELIKFTSGATINLLDNSSFRYVGYSYSLIDNSFNEVLFDTQSALIESYTVQSDVFVRVVMLRNPAQVISSSEIPEIITNLKAEYYLERLSELEDFKRNPIIYSSDLNLYNVQESLWERGGLNSSTGAEDNASGVKLIAIRTKLVKVLELTTLSFLDIVNYRYLVNAYSLIDESFTINLIDTSTTASNSITISADTYVRVVMLKTPTSTILDSEIESIIIKFECEQYIKRISELETSFSSIESLAYLTRFANKKIVTDGDSITYGYYNGSQVANPFPKLIGANFGMTVVNYAISGSVIAVKSGDETTHTPISDRFGLMDNDADVILIAGGSNDYHYSWTPIGTISDTTFYTFYGAMKILCEGLLDKYPGKRIFFCTPIKRYYNAYLQNTLGVTLEEYGDIIKEVCKIYSIPVLDMFAESGLNSQIPTQAALFIPDKTHPNQAGYNKMAEVISGFINRL